MRVAIAAEGFIPYVGGVEIRYTKIAEALSRKHQVDVLTVMQREEVGGRVVDETEKIGRIRVFRYKPKRSYFAHDGTRVISEIRKYADFCREILKNGDYDLVIASQWPLIHVLKIKETIDSTRIIVDWHEVWGRYYLRYGLKGAIGGVIERLIAGIPAKAHTTVSYFTFRRLIKIISKRSKILIVPNGVDTNEFNTCKNYREFGKIVFHGRFVPHKNLDILIEAYKMFKSMYEEASLHIIGDGPLLNWLKHRIAGLKDAYLHVAVDRKTLIKHLTSAWASVILTTREGQGIACLEAMAAGTPLIVADGPMNAFSKEVGIDSHNCLIVKPYVNDAVKALEKLAKDEILWNKLSREGCKTAHEYSWENLTEKLRIILGGDI